MRQALQREASPARQVRETVSAGVIVCIQCLHCHVLYMYQDFTCMHCLKLSFFCTAVICNGHHGNPIGSSSRVHPHIAIATGCRSSESSDSSSESSQAGWPVL